MKAAKVRQLNTKLALVFASGDACQFDWSHEHVEIDCVPQTIKVAHFRLAYSRQMFVAASFTAVSSQRRIWF
ncbi:hypothetical protein [Pseudomonas sp. MPB23]|uniref:hypothetical protein n=1 Tax=Pseudomonas sp. MPB23 TaxID=3388490 RepID=UPI0039851678